MDARHGLNPYGFKLITIMVKDENHQVGKLKSNWFMSDDAPQYYDACIEGMHTKEEIDKGLVPKKILC